MSEERKREELGGVRKEEEKEMERKGEEWRGRSKRKKKRRRKRRNIHIGLYDLQSALYISILQMRNLRMRLCDL